MRVANRTIQDEGISLNRIVESIAVVLAMAPVTAVAEPSERLMAAVLTDYLFRFVCIDKFPQAKAGIEQAFRASRIKGISVPCRELICSNEAYTRKLKMGLDRLESLMEEDLVEQCWSYSDSLQTLETEFDHELERLVPKRLPIHAK